MAVQFCCFPSFTIAQEVMTKSPVNTDAKLGVEFEITIDSARIISLMNKVLFRKEFRKGDIVFAFDQPKRSFRISLDTSSKKMDFVRLELAKNGIIINEITSNVGSTEKLVKYKPEIDFFLNLEDSTIFTNKFQDIPLEAIHPSRKDRYKLVQVIHWIERALGKAEQDLGKDKAVQLSETNEISVEAAEQVLLISAKKNVSKAQELLRKLGPLGKEIGFLSKEQKVYYESLKERLNLLYKKTNS